MKWKTRTRKSYLCDSESGEIIRLATQAEIESSRDAAPEGHIIAQGQRCFVDYIPPAQRWGRYKIESPYFGDSFFVDSLGELRDFSRDCGFGDPLIREAGDRLEMQDASGIWVEIGRLID